MNAAASPAIAMLRLLGGYQISQALFVAARARLADQLLDGPAPLAELAAASGLRPDPPARIVHVLAGEGVFAVDAASGLVRLGPLGRTLASGVPESVCNIALIWMETHYRAFGELWRTAETGRPAAELAYGMPFFDWLGQDPALVRVFTAAMTDFARAIRHHALDAVELDGAHTVVDLGGADGAVLGRAGGAPPAPTGHRPRPAPRRDQHRRLLTARHPDGSWTAVQPIDLSAIAANHTGTAITGTL